MYFKLTETTEFDANAELFTSKAIVCVIQADNRADAKAWFDKFAEIGFIKRSSVAEIEEATENEYYDYTRRVLR